MRLERAHSPRSGNESKDDKIIITNLKFKRPPKKKSKKDKKVRHREKTIFGGKGKNGPEVQTKGRIVST